MSNRANAPLHSLALIAVAFMAGRVALAGPTAKKPPTGDPQFRIAAVHAYLYYHQRGEFDRRDITSGTVALRNVFVGEGDASMPSGAMLVVVVMTGPNFARAVSHSATLTVTAGWRDHKAAPMKIPLSNFFSESQTISIPALVYGTPCSDVTINARLDGTGTNSEKTVTAPFSCGE